MQKKRYINLTMKENEDMSKHVTFKLGGKARYFYEPTSYKELLLILKHLQKEQIDFFIIGKGSNVVFRDKGYNGAVISLKKVFNEIVFDNNLLKVGAGVPLITLNVFCKQNGLSGLEFTYGIPASVGGAVCMNAGAFSHEICEFICKVEILKNGRRQILYKNSLEFGYRYSQFQQDGIILNVWFDLMQKSSAEIDAVQQNYLQERRSRFPNEPSSGSIFKRDKNIIPAKIIDNLGLKGDKLGGVEVSKKHAGFFVKVSDDATASDLENLVEKIRKKVYHKEKIELKTEIIFIGEK